MSPPAKPPSRTAVIFDMDGTLTRCVLDFDAIRAEIGMGATTILEGLDQMHGDERRRAESIIARHEAEAAANSELQPHAREVIAALRAAGVPVALMTRNSRRSVDTVLARHELTFEHVRTREDGEFKPSPRPVFDICHVFGVRPADAWVVGDYRFDLECGRAAGAHTVLMLERGAAPDWADLADHVIRDLRELLACMSSAGCLASPAARI